MESVSSSFSDRPASTRYLMHRMELQRLADPKSYNSSDTTFEILRNIVVSGAGNRAFTEKRTTAGGVAESISFHYTRDRIEMAQAEFGHLWPSSFTFDVMQKSDLELEPKKKLTKGQIKKIEECNLERSQKSPPLPPMSNE